MASATQAWRSAPDSPAGAVQTRMSLGGGVLLSPYDPATEEALAIAARVSGTYRNARRVPAKQPVPAAAEGPRWVDRLVAEAVQFDLIRTHGGVPGLRDEHALEAALARALQRHACEPTADLVGLAAAYGHGLATDHPFVDDNKRIAFVTLAVLLGLNGREIEAPEAEVVTTLLALAGDRRTEEQPASWVRSRLARTGAGEQG